jgi:hypothetical protein
MTLSVKSVNRGSEKGIEEKINFDIHRRNKASVPPLQPSTPLYPEVEVPLPSVEKVVPPPPPPVHELLPKPTSTEEEIHLNIDVSTMFGKLNMTIPVTDMCKIPSVRK